MYAFCRQGKKGAVYAVFNFDDKEVENYPIHVKHVTQGEVILDSSWEAYDAEIIKEKEHLVIPAEREAGGNVLRINVPAFTGIYIKV